MNNKSFTTRSGLTQLQLQIHAIHYLMITILLYDVTYMYHGEK